MHHRAGPVAHVRYEREAWISPHDNSVRVTLDRDVQISPEFVTRFTEQMDEPNSVFGRLVILELKFTGRFPDWFKEMVRIFHLRQGSASKYADGIARRGEVHFQARGDSTLRKVTYQSAARRDGRLAKIDRLSLTKAT